MEIRLILIALKRNKLGALLIALQIALTLAIVCNALFIIHQRTERMQRPTGIDEANIFTFMSQWVSEPPNLEARIAADLAALRNLTGVIDAYRTESFPLRGGGSSSSLNLQIDQVKPTARSTMYLTDEHAMQALGFRLRAGRWFEPEEIGNKYPNDFVTPANIVITQALAEKLFPAAGALGKSVYLNNKQTNIVGIVERLQTPWASSSWGEGFIENATLLPLQMISNLAYYVVRTQPGQREQIMQTSQRTLMELSRARVIDRVRTFDETRGRAYRGDRAMALMLGTVCALLVAVTAFGIVGLTSYWVAQRRRHIGVRRALGARRIDILRYFHTENFLVVSAGSALGIVLAVGGNFWMVRHFEMQRLSLSFVLVAVAIVLALGQVSVLWPALRATLVPPSLATRPE
jgi:putative ABC transport system permease protein